MTTTWDPRQYLRFADQRTRPAAELLARIPLEAPGRIVDLGCGAGNVTRLLAERWPAARVAGVDSSPEMLAEARAAAGTIEWIEAEAGTWRPAEVPDLIFSNSALHWLDGHESLFLRLLESLAPGGALAVQMPRNFDAPSHTAIAWTVRAGGWKARLEPLLRPAPVGPPVFYYDILARKARHVDLWETSYLHVLTGEDPVVEWLKGTTLKVFLDALEGKEREAFRRAYAERVRAAYPRRPDGTTLFTMRRIFLLATR